VYVKSNKKYVEFFTIKELDDIDLRKSLEKLDDENQTSMIVFDYQDNIIFRGDRFKH
jgi:hypothetical protein